MHNDYEDITSRIAEPPTWFDENGAPRYGAFNPDLAPDIYSDEAALAEIVCQDCGRRYLVAFTSSRARQILVAVSTGANAGASSKTHLASEIQNRTLAYGDPPNYGHADGCAGLTMSSDVTRIVEYWRRHDSQYVRADGAVQDVTAYFTWTRHPELEVNFVDQG